MTETTINAEAKNALGDTAFLEGDRATARYWYQRAADLGNADAMNSLGDMAFLDRDRAAARSWYQRAAELGNADAMNSLGDLAILDRDRAAARSWHQRAAELGNADALNRLSAGSTTAQGGQIRSAEHQIAGPMWFRILRSGGSTLLLTGLAATLSQQAALAMAGVELAPGARVWSTGGLVALFGALWMWKRATTWDRFKRAIWIPVGLVSALSFVTIGLYNSYDVEIVDQEARPASQSLQPTGKSDVVETSFRICEPGEDYLGCVNAHVAAYNSVCVGQSLSWSGESTCASLSTFIDDIQSDYDTCGYGCETGGQKGEEWGWPYLRLEAETAMQSNDDGQPRQSHVERCQFDLGVIHVGTCSTGERPESETGPDATATTSQRSTDPGLQG